MTNAIAFLDGEIFTGRGFAEALLIEDGLVRCVGSRRTVLRQMPTGAERIALEGDLVIPGLIDAHLHLAEITRMRSAADLRGVRSLRELGERVLAQGARVPEGPVLGRGWDQEMFKEHRFPTRAELDRWVPDRPALLLRVCDHAGVANSIALEDAGIRAGTPDPPGGRIGRSPNGAPDGMLFDSALGAVRPLWERIQPTPPEIAATTRTLAAGGLTTVGSMSATPEEIAATAQIPPDDCSVNVRFFLTAGFREQLPTLVKQCAHPGVRIVGLKVVTDGAFGPRTAWLETPYADAPTEVGTAIGSVEELVAAVEWAGEHDLGIGLHAIGDRALARVVGILERTNCPKARIEHASLVPPPLLPRLARLHVPLIVQPGFIASDSWLPDRLGEERVAWAYSFGTLLTRGIPLVFSTDAPVDPVDPWRGLRLAVERSLDPRTGAAHPAERLTALQAVTMATGAAGGPVGSPGAGLLMEGSPADLVRLRAPTLDAAIEDGAPGVRETWRAGRPTFSAQPSKDL